MATRYRSLEKYGKIVQGEEIYRKNGDGSWDEPFTITQIYATSGSGVLSVAEATLLEVRMGTRAVRKKNNGDTDILNVYNINPKDYYIKIQDAEE